MSAQKSSRDSFVLTVTIPSKTMNLKHKAMVFLPENYYFNKDSFSVVYLLHGYTGYYNNWYQREPRLSQYATRYNMIIVTPEGTFDSWYLDSPEDTSIRYETYIGKEVPKWINAHFKVYDKKENRAICGLSMGGHGALTIAADYPESYGAASSISGALDLRKYYLKWNLKKIIGDIYKYPSRWFTLSFAGKIFIIDKKNPPALLLDCGTEDIFYQTNESIHKLLLETGIKHDYFVRPGGHNWSYWKNALPYHLLFFQKYFENK